MNTKSKVFWITGTAMFVALLVVAQAITAGFGNTLVTGSVNNMLMVLAVMSLGLSSGVTVAALSPVVAKLAGIGPLWSLIPFILLGNLTLVLLWHFIGQRNSGHTFPGYLAPLIAAAVAKFLVLYLGIVRIAVPLLLRLPEQQAAVISGMFSVSQLITALAGGVIAALILPVLRKAIPAASRNYTA